MVYNYCKESHETAWVFSDKVTNNQIDNICIDTISSVKCVADSVSNHHLVNLKHDNTGTRARQKYNVESLKHKITKQNYKRKIVRDGRANSDSSIEVKRNIAKEAFITSLDGNVGWKKKKINPRAKQTILDGIHESC